MNTLWKILCLCFLLTGFALSQSGEGGSDEANQNGELNLERTQTLTGKIEEYLIENQIMAALISRRGKIVKPKMGVSDVDKFDATGMAHTGFVVRNGFSDKNPFITLNLVSLGAESELRAWSLEQFFIGSGEKDAIIMVPARNDQIKLWNALSGNLKLNPTEVEVKGQTVTRYLIENPVLERYHVKPYNLVSDYVFNQTMNCNEFVVKAMRGILTGKSPDEVSLELELHFKPYEFKISPFKLWMARNFTDLAIDTNERKVKGKSQVRVITVESMLAVNNRDFVGIEKVRVLREALVRNEYRVFPEVSCVKRNTASGKLNKKHYQLPLREDFDTPATVSRASE